MKQQTNNWQELMAKSQQGDKAAYNTLLLGMRDLITKYVRAKVRDAALDEDITQEVLIGVHGARHTYDTSKPFMPWLNAIIRYKTIDAFRKMGRNREDEMSTGDDIETFFTDSTNKHIQTLERHDLIKALEVLPSNHRKIVVLMKIHGLTATEVGKVLGMSVGAVKVTAHRAYKTLKAQLEG